MIFYLFRVSGFSYLVDLSSKFLLFNQSYESPYHTQ